MLVLLILAPAGAPWAQMPEANLPPPREEPKRLPNGKLQDEEILRAEYEANLKDLAEIRKLAQSVEDSLKKSKGHVLSLKDLKDLDQIEKLGRKVAGRLRRY